MKKSYNYFLRILKSDLKRYGEGGGKLLLFNLNVRFILLFRLGSWLMNKGLIFKPLSFLLHCMYHHYQYKLGVILRLGTNIGSGFLISHAGGIVINSLAFIGDNFTIFQNCTIGSVYGPNGGVPTIGDNVVMCAGSIVIGKVKIGNNVMIGAGAVVTKDVPDNAVVVGVPAKIVSYEGARHVGYYI